MTQALIEALERWPALSRSWTELLGVAIRGGRRRMRTGTRANARPQVNSIGHLSPAGATARRAVSREAGHNPALASHRRRRKFVHELSAGDRI
jgi:hypothetical protein